jgi:hypothetical protein
MTWIVGVPVPFGYAIGCADIRVTFKNGREEDCLQKIYQIGPYVCAAFAGSVRIGFELLSLISQLLQNVEPGTGWDLDEVAKWWPEDAREVWNRMPDFEQQLKSEFMLFGAHPNQGTPWPKPCVYTFRSPDFIAVQTSEPLEACSLGKGAGIRTYCDPLKDLWNDDDLVKLETGAPGGIARGMMDVITDKLLALPISGISPHMHVFLAYRDRIVAYKNDRQYFKKDGSMTLVPELVMPPVASSYGGFLKLSGGVAAVEGAIA